MDKPLEISMKKAVSVIGSGVMENAVEKEGAKGCSPILCTAPVCLEPPYRPFDGICILNPSQDEFEETVPQTKIDLTLTVFPAPDDLLSIDWMEALLRGLSSLGGPIAFELVGSQGSVAVRFSIPASQRSGFEAALHGLFPAVRLVEDAEPFPKTDVFCVEELVPVSPYHRGLTLLGHQGASPLGVAVTSIATLSAGDFGVLQVLLQPARPDHDWHYNVENLCEAEYRAAQLERFGGLSPGFEYDSVLPPRLDRNIREKVQYDVAFFAVVIRFAVWTQDSGTADSFLQGMRAATAMLRFGNRGWRSLSHTDLVSAIGGETVTRMVTGRFTHRPGLMLTTRETASIVHLPNDRTLEMFGCIAQRNGIEWTGPEATNLPELGRVRLGTNLYAGVEKPVTLGPEERLRQTYVTGTTGTGKSTLVENLVLDDINAGLGVCLVDPHGDLANSILERMPESRLEDLEYISFAESGLVPIWNPLASDAPPGRVADDMTHALLEATGATGARMEHNLRLMAFVVSMLRGCLEDIGDLAARTQRGEELRLKGLEKIDNKTVQRFLSEELPNYSESDLFSVRNKLSRLLLVAPLAATFQQRKNSIHPREWMDQGKVVVVNLASKQIGATHAKFVGGLLVSLVHRAALTRSDMPETERKLFTVYLDECQRLQSGTLEEMLSEGRKYGLAVVLAHQEGGQLGKDLSAAVGNCFNRVVFRAAEGDAPRLKRVLQGLVGERELYSLDVGAAFVSSGRRVASVITRPRQYPSLRSGYETARRFAKKHYMKINSQLSSDAKKKVRRPRVHDTFGKGGKP